MKIVLATKNPGKLKEFSQLAEASGWLELVLAPAGFDPEETGTTFRENAAIKAREAARMTGLIAVADDSGLTVEALAGRPGIYSSRYSNGDEALGRSKLLSELEPIPDGERNAAYVCSMVVSDPTGMILFDTECLWRGRIGYEERGENGFGFDPIFYLPDKDITVAELPPPQKNSLSHRGQAWRKVLEFLHTLKATKK